MADIENRMAQPGFWDNAEVAQERVAELKRVKAAVSPLLDLESRCEDLTVLFELAQEEQDESTLAEVAGQVSGVQDGVADLRFRAMLSGEHDHENAFLSIHAGAGGTESCDWAEMLCRMYSRWADQHRYQVVIVDSLDGEEAGLKNVTLNVKGEWAYGYLKAEIGVHRLVRISPFDSGNRRHTSFASVDVVPELADEIEIAVEERDLRVDTYRSSGAGGQHVNVTDSAVRITHLPTGIVVQCQNERSQHSNRRVAMKLLQARLYREREKEREAELARLYGEKGEIAWGNQIRSYVLQPYTLVKDHRSGHETSNTSAVLDGDLDGLIKAYLVQRIGA